jgi:hypothetical protein
MLTSPLGIAMATTGGLGEVPGAVGKVAKIAGKAAGIGFGAQGAEQAYKGGSEMVNKGVNAENLSKTAGGVGQALLGSAGALHGTEMGEQPATRALAAPVRAASKIGKPLSHIVPSVGGIVAADVAGVPHPYIVGATLGRFVLPPEVLERLFEKGRTLGLNDEEANIVHLQDRYKEAVKDAQEPERAYKAHDAGRQQGIPAPDDVLKAHEKAQKDLQSAEAHLKAAEEDYKGKVDSKSTAASAERPITPEDVAAARPEAPTPTKEENDAKLSGLMEKAAPTEKPAPTPENVKLPGQVQPETFPQEPTEAPPAFTGMRKLGPVGEGGVMGKQLALPEKATETSPEPAAAPEAPKTPLGEIMPPEKPAKPGRLGTLKVAEGGKVVDTEPALQQKIEEGLQGTAKPVATPAPRAFEEVLPKHEEVAEEPKKFEEALPKHEEHDYSPEHETKVEQVLSQHSDQDLIRFAKKSGIDTDKYDFAKRDEKRHRVERDQLVKDLLGKLPEEDKSNISRLSDEFNKKDSTLWSEAERNALSKAQRSRAIIQEHEGGAANVAGGAPNEHEAAVKEGGGEYKGVQEGVPEHNLKGLVLFDHPETKSTLALPEDEVTPEAVKAKLEAHKADWDKAKNDAIVKEHNANGGSSLLKSGKVESGYVVGINKELESVLNKEHIDADDVKAYREKPEVQKALKDNPEAFIGTWVDGRKTYFDTSVHVPELEDAKNLAKDNKQLAIFDANSKTSIPLEAEPEGVHKPGEAESDTEMARRGADVPEKAKPYKDMTPEEQEELAAKGQSGGAPEKKLPTGDELIKKYGESNGDPAHTAFILADGRGVAHVGSIHDEMLGGKATDKNPPRERFIEQGNIRVRAHGVMGNRETAFSIPDRITPEQLAYIKKMGPQLRSGAVLIEGGRPGSAYRTIEYGKATDEALEKNIREISQVLQRGRRVSESPEATEFNPEKFKTTTGEDTSLKPLAAKKRSPLGKATR